MPSSRILLTTEQKNDSCNMLFGQGKYGVKVLQKEVYYLDKSRLEASDE